MAKDEGQAIVFDAVDQRLSPCPAQRAQELIATGKADLLSTDPLTIRLRRRIELPAPQPDPIPPGLGPGGRRRILLHACCGPCGTYPALRLREESFDVTLLWYNPNIHPFAEHERRRQALLHFAAAESFPVVEWPTYDLVPFLRTVAGQERFGERCQHCYRMRLERTAQVAQQRGFDAFSTTLLISPYQDEAAIQTIGKAAAQATGVEFYVERFRRGWNERGRLAKRHDLYRQDYCGCIYSEWERREATATQPAAEETRDERNASGDSGRQQEGKTGQESGGL